MLEQDEYIQETEPLRRRLIVKTVPTRSSALRLYVLLVILTFHFLLWLFGFSQALSWNDSELQFTTLYRLLITLVLLWATVYEIFNSPVSARVILDGKGVHWRPDPGILSRKSQSIPWRELCWVLSLGVFGGRKGDIRLVVEGGGTNLTFHSKQFDLKSLKSMFFFILEKKEEDYPLIRFQDNCKWLLDRDEA